MVQDFVQVTEEGETPRDWLHRIMSSSSRENSDYDISLLGETALVAIHEEDNQYPCSNTGGYYDQGCCFLFVLLGIFGAVDCHTLFLPAVKKGLLQDLSSVGK